MNGIYIEMHIFPCRINDSVSPIYHTITQIDGTTNFIYMYSLVHYHVNPKHVQCDNLKFFSTRIKGLYLLYISMALKHYQCFLKE